MSDIRVDKRIGRDDYIYIYDRFGGGYISLHKQEAEFVKERLIEELEEKTE